jgi:hypothetical protein
MQDFPTKTDGISTEPAAEYNNLASELKTTLESLGIAFNASSIIQLTQAISTYGQIASYYTDTGTANNYILSVVPATRKNPPSYYEGMEIYFFANNTNTGSSNVNVAGLGSVTIKDMDGNNLTGGEIEANKLSRFVHDGTYFKLDIPSVPVDQNDKLRISAVDTTNGYGGDKFVAGDGLDLTKLNPSGNEQLKYAVDLASDSGLEFSAGDLKVKPDSANGLQLTSAGIGIKPNGVKDTHIDWGIGAGQVSTDDIPEGTTNKWATWEYDSGWFSTSNNTLNIKAHGISLDFPGDPLDIIIFWRASSGGSYIVPVPYGSEPDTGAGSHVSHNATNIYIKNFGFWVRYVDSGGASQNGSAGEIRILARKAI